MKGLNVKRIAALGLGAALVGSALAPAVMAGVFNNVDTLQKSNIVNSTGTPVVDIVVGSMGQAADVVWAGNIAAKVAQLATVDATAAAPTVDFTVGGSTTVTGDGELVDDITVTASTSLALTVDNGDSTVLIDESDWEYDINGDTYEVDIAEQLVSTATAGLQTDGEGILPGQLVANVDANKIRYEIRFTPALAEFTKDDDVELSIPFLGKTWEVRSINGSTEKVELRASELSDKLFVGEIVKVAGIGAYAGKQLDLVLTEVAAAEDNASSYLAEFELRDGSTVIDVLSDAEAGTDLQDKFNKYFSTPVSVDTVYRQIDTSKGYVRLDTGDQAWDLEDGEELKDDGNDDAEKWMVTLDFNGDDALNGIYVYNSDLTYAISDADSSDLQGTKDDAYRMGPMAANTSIDIADAGKYKFSFLGLTTEKMYEGSIADGVLSLTIDKKLQEVPLSFGGSSGYTENSSKTVTVLGEEYTLYYDADSNTLKSFHDISDSTDTDDDAGDVEIVFDAPVAGDFNDDTVMTFGDGDVDVKYNVIAYFNDTDEITYMLGLSNDSKNTALHLEAGTNFDVNLEGTYVDRNVDAYDSTLVPYYLPVDMPDDIFDNWADGNLGLESDDQDLYAAVFTTKDTDTAAITVRVDTKTGDLIDTDNDYAGISSTASQAEFGSVELDSSVDDELVAAGTTFGTEISVADSKFAWSVPEDRRYAQIYLGAMATEATTDGAKYTNVAVDGVKGNVTIDAINGTAGKSVVKVGNIVKLDTEAVSGKAIIVGGQLVNNMAKNLQIDGVTIQERLGNNGDYVAAVLDNGSVVVAGWTSNDTAMAARALIAQLESFM